LLEAILQIIQLRADLEAIDGALRVFDPTIAPRSIRPKIKRKPPTHFRHGQFGRAVMDTIRRSNVPMTARAVAEQIARDFRLDVQTTETMNKLVSKVRAALSKPREGIVSERRGEAILWQCASEAS
jgi:hypothetical protein